MTESFWTLVKDTALRMLGDLYATGRGVDKALLKAIELFTAAEEKGSTYAKRRLEEVYEEQRKEREC